MAFTILSFALLVAFYGCYAFKMLRQKKAGITTDQLGKGKTGFIKFIEIALKVVTILVPLAEIASIVCGTAPFPTWVRVVGLVIAAIGTGVFITAVATMRDSWRAGVPENEKTKLVTNGIFSLSRNPAFLGFDLLYVGILLVFFNSWLMYVSLLGMVMFHLQIVNVEEDFLMFAFGSDYLIYKKRVCRYFGRKK